MITFILKFLGLAVYYLSFLFPRKRSIWAFGSGTGYDGHSKYLLQYIIDHQPEIRGLWITQRKDEVEPLRKKGIEAYYSYGLKGIFYSLRAGTYIVTGSLADINFYTSGGAKQVQLWHGFGPKKCLWANIHSSMNKNGRFTGFVKRPAFYVEPDIVLGASEMIDRIYATTFRTDIDRCVDILSPRCVHLRQSKKEILEYIKKWEGQEVLDFIATMKKYKKVLLYMPTYREKNPHFLEQQKWDIDALNDTLKHKDALLIVKLHPHMKHDLDFNGLSNIVEMDKNLDLYPILPFTDTLITDYSSVYVDYILMDDKQIILYIPDKEDYKNNSRDLWEDFDETYHGITAMNFHELLKAISSDERQDYTAERALIWADSIHRGTDELVKAINNLR
ncbi:MAG: CDP-glycerol glycerophosphotransferase family protein [Prevotella sp.]|nr:CDP-glycerol glycerophosphotransferase family protein [Prevotella sp.]